MSRAQQFLVPLLGSVFVPQTWFNPDPALANRILIQDRIDARGFWAWRAESNDVATWEPGPANYAASLVSVEGNAVSLSEGNGAVPWAGATGWGFVAGALQYFLTSIIPTNDQAYAMLIQYANDGNTGSAAGQRGGAGARQFRLAPRFSGFRSSYFNGGEQNVAPAGNVSGNTAVVGNQGYRNGVADGPAIAAWTVHVPTHDIYIGAYNNIGAAISHITAEIHSVIICDDAAAILPSIASLAALPNGSMHNT